MIDEELIAQLRKGPEYVYRFVDIDHAAADRIVALKAQLAEAEKYAHDAGDRVVLAEKITKETQAENVRLRAKVARLEGALRIIGGNSCITCSAEAFNVLFAERHPRAALTDGGKDG